MTNYYIDNYRVFRPKEFSLPLVHITSNWDALNNIIKEGFKPSYCIERLSDINRSITAAFPMISFSNLPVQTAINRLASYGTLGIALKTTWGQRHKLNPVLYLDRNSQITESIIKSFDTLSKFDKAQIENSIHNDSCDIDRVLFRRNLILQFAYSKNYDDQLIRRNEIQVDNYSFGLEREWRIVEKTIDIDFFITQEQFSKRNEFNNNLTKRYTFDQDDIDTIIVESEEEIELIKELLQTKYGSFNTNVKFEINRKRHIPDE